MATKLLVDMGDGLRLTADVDPATNTWTVTPEPADDPDREAMARMWEDLLALKARQLVAASYQPEPENQFALAIVAHYPGSRILSGLVPVRRERQRPGLHY